MSRLSEIQREYEAILALDIKPFEKDKKLSALMTIMEGEFRIPLLRDKEWEENNKPVIAMYRKLSISRQTV
ncbi:hypothetical protein BCE02nite_56130 [Brevibacillus centrosporus]|nr:hypothetical protein BCE02nite_56130 [Brevibacillus centrosporus]